MDAAVPAWVFSWTAGIALVASVLFLAGSILTDINRAVGLATLVLSYPVVSRCDWVHSPPGKRRKTLSALFPAMDLPLHKQHQLIFPACLAIVPDMLTRQTDARLPSRGALAVK